MPLDDPNFPLQFLVGRSLAQKENVDDATATRLALVGSMLAGGFFGPVIARQLAIREAPPAPAPVVTPPPGTPPAPPTIGSRVDALAKQFDLLIKADKQAEAEARAKAAALNEQAQKLQQERSKMLAELCASFDVLAKDTPAKSPPTAK